MKNHKQLLSDFYLALLAIHINDKFRIKNMHLYAFVRDSLSRELEEEPETIQRIFERMAAEDAKTNI